MLFLRSHKLKILLNIDTEFFKTPELLNLMKLISCYYGKLGEAHLTLYNLENFNLIRDSIKNNDDGGNSGGNYYYIEIMDAKKRMLYVV